MDNATVGILLLFQIKGVMNFPNSNLPLELANP